MPYHRAAERNALGAGPPESWPGFAVQQMSDIEHASLPASISARIVVSITAASRQRNGPQMATRWAKLRRPGPAVAEARLSNTLR